MEQQSSIAGSTGSQDTSPRDEQPLANQSGPLHGKAGDVTESRGVETLCMKSPAQPTVGASGGAIDIQSLCLSQDYQSMADATKVVTSVSICKPSREWFFRIHPEFQRYMAILEVKGDKEFYIVAPKLLPQLSGEATPKLLVLGVTRQGKFFFWPLKVEADRGLDEWSKSALMEWALPRRAGRR
jgi:hypothetical protein